MSIEKRYQKENVMINIEEIVERIRKGEESKEILYRNIKPFLDFQEKKYSIYINGKDLEYGDLKTLVWMGVERAIETYCREKNYKFLTWAASCIKYVFINEYNKTKNREVPFDVVADGGEEMSMEEIVSDSTALTAFENAETKIDGRKAMLALKDLSEDERKAVISLCIKNIPLAKVARGMKMTEGRVRTLKLSALKKLRNAILQ